MRNVCILFFVIAALAIVGCQKAGQIEIDEASEGIVDITVEGELPPEGTFQPESPGWDFAGGGWSEDGEEVAPDPDPDPEPEPFEPYELSGHGLVRLDGVAIASPLPVPVRVNVGMNFSRDLTVEEKAEVEAGFSLKDALGAALLGVFEWVDDNSLLFKLSRNLDYNSTYTYHVMNEDALFTTMVRGDINGDGVSDVIIGEYGWNLDTGRAHVLNGTNLAGSPIAVKEGEAYKDRFGFAVASAGDVNADGYADVIIGAPGFDPTGPILDAGKIYIYFGPVLDDANMIAIEGAGKQENFGRAVAGGGFIDDDGYADMAVGSPYYTPTSNPSDANKGRVYVISGANPSTPNSKVDGQLALESLGFSIAFAGDQDGNGLDDLIAGAPGFDSSSGRILILKGANIGSPPITEKRGEVGSAEQFGYSVASGILDGDGRMDFIVGAPFYGSGQEGKVFLFSGSNTLATDLPVVEWKGEFPGDRFGLSVASTADIDGDEFDEVLIGAPNFNTTQGRIYLCRGLEPLPTCLARQGYVWDAGLGNSVARTGDFNGDGKDDIVVGASGANAHKGRYRILNVFDPLEVLGSGEGANADNRLGCAVGGN